MEETQLTENDVNGMMDLMAMNIEKAGERAEYGIQDSATEDAVIALAAALSDALALIDDLYSKLKGTHSS